MSLLLPASLSSLFNLLPSPPPPPPFHFPFHSLFVERQTLAVASQTPSSTQPRPPDPFPFTPDLPPPLLLPSLPYSSPPSITTTDAVCSGCAHEERMPLLSGLTPFTSLLSHTHTHYRFQTRLTFSHTHTHTHAQSVRVVSVSVRAHATSLVSLGYK